MFDVLPHVHRCCSCRPLVEACRKLPDAGSLRYVSHPRRVRTSASAFQSHVSVPAYARDCRTTPTERDPFAGIIKYMPSGSPEFVSSAKVRLNAQLHQSHACEPGSWGTRLQCYNSLRDALYVSWCWRIRHAGRGVPLSQP